MPEIEIRAAQPGDYPALQALDHSYHSNYVWQMERNFDPDRLSIAFRQTRLPRQVRVEYGRTPRRLNDEWQREPGIVLKALLNEEIVGYIRLKEYGMPFTVWATDLAVRPDVRRKGIGSGLVLAAQGWADQHGYRKVMLEMQAKNDPAVCMAEKLGYEFCGYQDQYYANQDIALFYICFLR